LEACMPLFVKAARITREILSQLGNQLGADLLNCS
jgi:hypothetical protein